MNALQEMSLLSCAYPHRSLGIQVFPFVNMLSITTPEEYLAPLNDVNSGECPHSHGVHQPWRSTHPEVGVEVIETVKAEAETPVVQKSAKVVFRAELNSPYGHALY